MSMTRKKRPSKAVRIESSTWKAPRPTTHGKRQRERAIELEKVKIKALRPVSREQVEKVWKGEWKHYLPPLGAGDVQCGGAQGVE